MIVIVSPAKSINTENLPPVKDCTIPVLLEKADYLAKKLQKNSVRQLQKLMHVNADIAALNFQRYQDWDIPFNSKNAFPAASIFTGEVYRGWKFNELSEKQQAFAQHHVRILSGLYGLLRPKDLMMPYRLEMGTRWNITATKKNNYQYWGDTVAKSLTTDMDDNIVINLASNEYSKVVLPFLKDQRIINFQFKDWKNGEYKALMTYAKLARGMMTRYICTEEINTPEGLKGFAEGGYVFNPKLSNDNEWIFTRN